MENRKLITMFDTRSERSSITEGHTTYVICLEVAEYHIHR